MYILEVNNIEKNYGSGDNMVRAVHNMNFKVEKGEFIALVGASGCGKSTLLNLIGGLDSPSKGEIIINNKNIVSLTRKDLPKFRRSNIGFIFQNYSLMPILNVYDNVALPASLNKNKPVNHLYIEKLLKELGLWSKRDKFPNELSGGQQQRVAIARALSNKPAIILADEPTGNLDSKTTMDVMRLLKESNEKFNQTILMVTHNDSLAEICDRTIHIVDGTIICRGGENK